MTVLESSPIMPLKDVAATDATADGDDGLSDVKPGMITDVKNLYQSKPDNRGGTTWLDTYPDDIQEAAENAESARYALLVRNSKCYDDRKMLEIDSIVIQSPLLKRVLGSVLKDYPGVTTTLDHLTFQAPFQPFIHRWKNLLEAIESEQDLETKAHLELFHRVLEAELRDDLKARDDFIFNGVITHSTMWMIFEPGTTVLAAKDGQYWAARLNTGHYQETRAGKLYTLACQIVDWDGGTFGIGRAQFEVWEYEGTTRITNLAAYPLKYHTSLTKVKEALAQRGKKFEELSGHHHKNYEGVAVGECRWGPVTYNVDSRILIDTDAWNRFNPDKQVQLSALKACHVDCGDDSGDDSDEKDSGDDDNVTTREKGSRIPLTTSQLILCSASLKGYSLKDKKWLTFSIGSVSEIVYSETVFEDLVLPIDQKELVFALAESHHRDTFNSMIQDNSENMIVPLSGPPEIDNTITAMFVAEIMRIPLYVVNVDDLGLAANETKSSLDTMLEMASKWSAVLVFDEAALLLEQPSLHDLERNQIVLNFLRLLKTYEGIFFLFTNRVGNLDAAWQSRIHISMQYGELNTPIRRLVWDNSLNASSNGGIHNFSDEDLDKLAGHKLNGHEIEDVLKRAQLRASMNGMELSYQHVESVLAME